MFEHGFALHGDLGTYLEVALIEIPKALAAIPLHARVGRVLQVCQEVADVLLFLFVKEVGILEVFLQVAAIAFEISRFQETPGQDLRRIEG